jgi:two-component system response regulator AtoC
MQTEPGEDSSRDPAAYVLVVSAPGRSISQFLVEAGRSYTIGRGRECNIRLDFPWVSKTHAIIHGGHPPEIVDANSRNGSRLGGRKLVGGRRYPLAHESVIAIGRVSLLVQRIAGVPTTVPPNDATGSPSRGSRLPKPARRAVEGEPFVTRSAKMLDLGNIARQVSSSDVSVLVLGETGVGKELLAHAIHRHSSRGHRPLFTLNCAAIPENLVESELFGYRPGAFSGAITSKLGLFEAAHGSTLFLDEIGDLPRVAQAKLLRVLETGEVVRLGSVRPARVDVRIVAATNRNLQADIAAGNFRADLFYRISGLTLTVPPLRERPEDIQALAEHFAARSAKDPVPQFTAAALQTLLRHDWPGNVRELRSVVERALLLATDRRIDASLLVFDPAPLALEFTPDIAAVRATGASLPGRPTAVEEAATFLGQESPTGAVAAELSAELERRELRRIRDALERAGGNQKDAAKLLGVSRRTLINRLEQYGIARPRKRRDSGPAL